MRDAARGRLGRRAAVFSWLFEPLGETTGAARVFLLGQLLSAPSAAVMGSLCALVIVTAAFLRSGNLIFTVLMGLETLLIVLRLTEWRTRQRRMRADPAIVPTVDISVLTSFLWCTLQGVLAFIIMSGNDAVMQVLSATLIMALIGPICARNYAAPRFAFLLVLLCDLPFVAGAIASGEAWLTIIVAITPPFLLGAIQIIKSFHHTMVAALAAQAKNLHLALHDSLTGILNRQGMDAALAQIRPGQNRSMALMVIDLDGFKQVNDHYGHGAGDLLLIQVAQRIQAQVGEHHLVGRMGGDEFMVVMRDVLPDEAGPCTEGLIAAISHCLYDLSNGIKVRVGASIGFACLPEDAISTVELRLRADQALYRAKGAGKGVGLRYG